MPEKLRIGKITYLNLVPIFSALKLDERFEIVEGYPAELNRMLRTGTLDVSPSSSIEYLRDKDRYGFIDGHSISSMGPVRSLLLFSRVPLEDLCRHEIMATYQSETTVALLRVLLDKYYGFDCKLTITEEPFYDAIARHSAYLSIGDDALEALYSAHMLDTDKPEDCYAMCTINHQAFYVYDIAQLWAVNTGLPAVLALWIHRANLGQEKLALLNDFKDELDRALLEAKGSFTTLAHKAAFAGVAPEKIEEFWRGICYDFPPECKEGLSLFESHLREMELI